MKETELIKGKIINKIKDRFVLENYDLKSWQNFSYPKFIPFYKFNVEQYKAIGLGNIAILQTKSMMKMDLLTVVFTPERNKDIPFVIVDFVAMKNDFTVFIEFFYNHVIDKESIKYIEEKLIKKGTIYDELKNYDEKPNWYVPLRSIYSPLKKGNENEKKILELMILDYLEVYLRYASTANKDKKNLKLESFINDLIVKGNPSSSILEKALGKEEADQLFRKVIFCYK